MKNEKNEFHQNVNVNQQIPKNLNRIILLDKFNIDEVVASYLYGKSFKNFQDIFDMVVAKNSKLVIDSSIYIYTKEEFERIDWVKSSPFKLCNHWITYMNKVN